MARPGVRGREDDAARYARPDYIRELNKRRGRINPVLVFRALDQLIHISSGVIRHFLDSAAKCTPRNKLEIHEWLQVSTIIQNKVVRHQADQLFFAEV